MDWPVPMEPPTVIRCRWQGRAAEWRGWTGGRWELWCGDLRVRRVG